MKPCLAFLQNMWVRDPDRVRRDIARLGEDYRNRIIEFFLFRGCLTGRRIRHAFGDELLAQITWEESTREIAGNPRQIFPPDPAHILAALTLHRPAVVLTFGRIAGDAVQALWAGPLIRVPHPAARQADTCMRLQTAVRELQEALDRVAAEPPRVWKQEHLGMPSAPVNDPLGRAWDNLHGRLKSVSNP